MYIQRTLNKTICVVSIALMILPVLQSCSGVEESSPIPIDPFIGEIEMTLEEIDVTIGPLADLSVVSVPLRVLAIPDSDLLVGVDYVDKSLALLDPSGSELSRVGGHGRGPEEFEGIGRLHLGDDGRLYVMDPVLRRFNVFDIDVENGELIYETTIVPEPDLNLRLQEIYVTETGFYGVFNRTNDYQTGANSYYFYAVDETFRPVKHLLEMPGDEKLKISEVFFIDDLVGQSTFWDLDGEWFYYITSHSSEVYKYHLETGEWKAVQYFNFRERPKTPGNTAFLQETLQSLIESNPPVGEAIEKSQTLPLFRGLLVQDSRILLSVYHAGGDYGVILYVDLESGEVSYMKTPPYFRRLSLRNEMIYGIDSTPPDERRMMFIKLKHE